MKKLLLLSGFLLSGCLLHGQQMKRLLLFAEDSGNAKLRHQLHLLRSDSAGIVEHNIWIAVFDSPRKMRRMFEYYKIGRTEFTLLVTGLGGVEIFRSEEVTQPEKIYRIIEKAEAEGQKPHSVKAKGQGP